MTSGERNAGPQTRAIIPVRQSRKIIERGLSPLVQRLSGTPADEGSRLGALLGYPSVPLVQMPQAVVLLRSGLLGQRSDCFPSVCSDTVYHKIKCGAGVLRRIPQGGQNDPEHGVNAFLLRSCFEESTRGEIHTYQWSNRAGTWSLW